MKLETILKSETLEQLNRQLAKAGHDAVRPDLLNEFFSLVEYRNALQWNRLVRVCESLAIVGWGKCEPVEASADKWINGQYFTKLSNAQFEERYLSAGWRRVGDSFVVDGGWCCYHASKDRPERRKMDCEQCLKVLPPADPKNYRVKTLERQRNPLPKNPIRISRYSSNQYPTFDPITKEIGKLRKQLDRLLRPAAYGENFGYLGIACSFSDKLSDYFHDKSDVPKGFKERYWIRPRVDIGRLTKCKGELRLVAQRHFPAAFAELPLGEQKRQFGDDLLEMIDAFAARLRAKKIAYDTNMMREDVEKILRKWVGTK